MPQPLAFLFAAGYIDGTTFAQDPSDVSSADPTKSSFFDVRQSDVMRFGIFSTFNDPADHYVVDLSDGHFEINSAPFHLDPLPVAEDGEPPMRRLIFFRRHRHRFNVEMHELAHEVEYHIGFQATIDGVNHQRTIAVLAPNMVER